MPQGRDLGRIGAALVVVALVVLHAGVSPRAQAVPAIDRRITYILPQWLNFLGVAPSEVTNQVAQLRSRIGEGPRVRVGFTTYVGITMSPVDPSDTATIRSNLAATIAQMDAAISRAQANNIPICLSFVTAIRAATDPLQDAAQNEDRRDMQWHSDNTLAAGWTTFSRYARKQEAIQEAYIRELGRQLASRMALYPDIVVAASGDGEIEMAYDAAPLIADYSPFAVAEFRDWLRATGWYAPGQPFAGEAYANASRYAGASGLQTLNADFNLTPAFDTWNLKYFDWDLGDPTAPDPHAIPASQYAAAAFNPFAVSNPNGFDPPRNHIRGNPWSDLWDQFRQSEVYRHNREFAKWITTSADPASGATVPPDRWYTDQIPADYLFGGTPANPNGRLDTSASTIATADVTPYGSLGITSFNTNIGSNDAEASYARTLVGAAPVIAARHVRWGIFEWNPAVPPSTGIAIYNDEMALVRQYRPSLLAPYLWQASGATAAYGVENTLFETALRQLVQDLNSIPLTLSRTSMDIGALSTGAAISPPQTIRVSGVPGESPAWSITSAPPYLNAAPAPDGRSFTVALKPGTYAPGIVTTSIVVSPSEPGYAPATLTVTLRVSLPGATHPPQGAVDTPAEGAVVAGEVGVTGWAVDDIGLASVAVCRDAVGGEAPAPDPRCGGLTKVFIGNATFVPGARPDVFAAFPGEPLNDQAGWGYMILTNMLPNGGNGTFNLAIVASDVDGHSVVVAQRHIVCQNAQASVPFGTIDTPSQGQTVSGSAFVNFGWALAPQPHAIPLSGSTIDVLVDGTAVGHPTYGLSRPDIDSLFPGYQNSGHAVGYFVLDTTTLLNGIHTIAWVVHDADGNTQGVGSRFFTVANP